MIVLTYLKCSILYLDQIKPKNILMYTHTGFPVQTLVVWHVGLPQEKKGILQEKEHINKLCYLISNHF